MGVVLNGDPNAHTFSIISTSAYPAAYWGSNRPPPPRVSGGTVRYPTHDLAVGVKAQLNSMEYSRAAELRTQNALLAKYGRGPLWVPVNSYSIVDNGPQGSNLMARAEADSHAGVSVYQEIGVALPNGADPAAFYNQLQQVATQLQTAGFASSLVAAMTMIIEDPALRGVFGIGAFADLATVALFATSFTIGAFIGTGIYMAFTADAVVNSDYMPIYLLDQPIPNGLGGVTCFGGGASAPFTQLEEMVE